MVLTDMGLASGTRLGPYEILVLLGAGGMGEVYRARDTRLGRDVAIKVVPERVAANPEAVARFNRETRAVAALAHPNIVVLYDCGTEEGHCYAVMELLEGETLSKRLEQGRLPWREALTIALAVAQGLEAAHAKGIVHRDIKPENIFLTSGGSVKILDFGIARLKTQTPEPVDQSTGPMDHATEPGVVIGTIYYMSPEQARGLPTDARSDIFSLGCVLYQMVTGRRPFDGPTKADIMVAILNGTPAAPSTLAADLPVGVEHVISRCLHKSPEGRFQTAQEVVVALRAALQGGQQETGSTSAAASPTTATLITVAGSKQAASLAVLPFVNMSADKENEYFSDGLAEELIYALSKVTGLHVASRTSSFAFKGKNQDVREIGQQLNVANVLEGSVRKAGNRVRITAQLVSVADGFQLWSETYNRQMEDIFEIQAEIADNIARALSLVLTDKARRALEKARPADVQAFDFYLRGMEFFHQFRRNSVESARAHFSRAIEIDPTYARAYAGLADCHSALYTNWDKNDTHLKEADAASRKALELGPNLAETHAARGQAVMLNQRYDEATREFEQAIKLNPRLFEAYYFYAQCAVSQGKLEDAARLFARAGELRPEDYQAPIVGAGVLSGLGRKAEAEQAYRRGLDVASRHLEQHPEDARAYYLGATAWCGLGQPERGLEWAQKAMDIDPEEPMTLYNVACVYSLQKKVEEAITCLENAVRHGFRDKAWIENDSDLKPCRTHPRFQALLASL